nr:M15 family metallopeptidase [Bacillus sp. FJAT-50079]
MMVMAIFLAGCTVPDFLTFKKQPNAPTEEQEQNHEVEQVPEEEPIQSEEKNEEVENEIAIEAAYFNDTHEVNGITEIKNPDNVMALVNKIFALPETYEPEDLVRPNVEFSFGDQDIEKSYLRKDAAEALENMFEAAESEGIYLFAVSGYRSYERQKAVFDAEIARVGEEQALQAVAYPGKSEHQTGLAMDISSQSAQFLLSEQFGETAEGQWLKENAHRYGFILRYPQEKEDITEYQYEPWHFRYVGEKVAGWIYEHGWTLEEFFQEVKKL